MTYLALHVISAKGLLSRSEDGHEPAAGRHSTRHPTRHSPPCSSRYRRSEDGHDANPFVTATWDQVSQQTRVVRRSTAPQFGETIYFPLRLLTLHGEEGKKALEKKGGAAATPPTHPSHASNAAHLPRPASPPPTSTAHRRAHAVRARLLPFRLRHARLPPHRSRPDHRRADAQAPRRQDPSVRIRGAAAHPAGHALEDRHAPRAGASCRRRHLNTNTSSSSTTSTTSTTSLPVTGVLHARSPGGDQARGAQARRHTARRQVRRARKGVAGGGAAAALGARPLHALRDGRDQHDPIPAHVPVQVQPAPRHRGPDDGRADGELRGGSNRERRRPPRAPSSPPRSSSPSLLR